MNFVRRFYYTLNPKMRFVARRVYYFIYDIFNKEPGMPPTGLIYTGSGDFKKQGLMWRSFFIDNGLQADHAFLDIGSGIGRIALGLKDFLHGAYHGFEAMEVGVQWCQQNITPKHTNFQFNWIPLYNDLYNSDGIDAANYRFDYQNEYFDFAASISVFTHMIDTEIENYLSQTNRVLKKGGILVATFFITDDGHQNHKNANAKFSFPYEQENYFLMDKKVKSANVCFKRLYLNALFEKTGFMVVNEIKGFWSGSPKVHDLGFQDIVVLKKVS